MIKLPLPRNPISLLGVLLATLGAVLFLIFALADAFGLHSNPYMGIVFFIVLPGIFLLGLLLIPIGGWLHRRRVAAGRTDEWPRIDFNNPRHRSVAFIVFGLTIVNLLIVSMAAYSSVEYMDSTAFCGTVCHEPMRPEHTAFQAGPHAGGTCVQCHIGPGATGFVRAKMAGTRQLYKVAFNSYARPIETPVRTLRPADETCGRCHFADRSHGDTIQTIREYGDDEKNTLTETTLQMHVGGGNAQSQPVTGIHWHASSGTHIEYVATDAKRQVIASVRLTAADGTVREYVADGAAAADIARGERHRMDCVDCHNRPGHPFAATAARAVDAALQAGELPSTLPFVRREAVAAVNGTYATAQAGADAIATKVRDFYRTQHPDVFAARRADIERAVSGAQAVYGRNVFPSMKVGFGTYVNNLGHVDSSGCFRCHDDNHKSKDGRVISQTCETCHGIK